MPALLRPLTITTALSLTPGTVFQFESLDPRGLGLQASFIYGSGGTSVDAYVQTSLDEGATWVDIANFHFLLASAVVIAGVSSMTPNLGLVTPTDGAMAANSVADGIIGDRLRVKYKSVGTYGGGTSLAVWASGGRLRST